MMKMRWLGAAIMLTLLRIIELGVRTLMTRGKTSSIF